MKSLKKYLAVSAEVQEALKERRPVVALESTIISHGMPYPQNVETALSVEKIIRENGAIPATIAILGGKLTVGCSPEQIEYLGKKGLAVTKASRRDLPVLLSRGEDGATTVTTTMIGAALAGIRVFATGGIGGLYRHSTNFRQLTGDAVAIALKHGIETEHVNYIQVHPTTFYSEEEEDRSFLISESVRGEGAKLYGKDMKRFTNELLPRDLLTIEILKQMKKDGTKHVWEDLRTIPHDELVKHFPNIIEHCKEQGYDVTKECIPVVPAQHYFMGGVRVNYESRTSMPRLYAVGECACNGVHGRNRLASNSLLEALVFAKRAANDMLGTYSREDSPVSVDLSQYNDADALEREYAGLVQDEIEREGGPSSTRIAYRDKFARENEKADAV